MFSPLLAYRRDVAPDAQEGCRSLPLVRKLPEIFCLTLTILTSLSAWLLSNGTPKSSMNLSTASRCLSNH